MEISSNFLAFSESQNLHQLKSPFSDPNYRIFIRKLVLKCTHYPMKLCRLALFNVHTVRLLFFTNNNIFFGYCEPFRYPNYVCVLLKYEFIYNIQKSKTTILTKSLNFWQISLKKRNYRREK